MSVSGLPQREINTLLRRRSLEGPLRVVAARSAKGGREELQALMEHGEQIVPSLYSPCRTVQLINVIVCSLRVNERRDV